MNHLPVETVDISIIQTLKQSSVCCSQIMNYLLPFNETILVTKRMNDVLIDKGFDCIVFHISINEEGRYPVVHYEESNSFYQCRLYESF